jgi:hypothetical protein
MNQLYSPAQCKEALSHGEPLEGLETQPTQDFMFTREQQLFLKAFGYWTYTSTGLSIVDMQERGYQVNTVNQRYLLVEPFMQIKSAVAHVAVNLREPYLQGSIGKTLREQIAMIADFDQIVRQRIPGCRVVQGLPADYAFADIEVEEATRTQQKPGIHLFQSMPLVVNITATQLMCSRNEFVTFGKFENGMYTLGTTHMGDHQSHGIVPLVVNENAAAQFFNAHV